VGIRVAGDQRAEGRGWITDDADFTDYAGDQEHQGIRVWGSGDREAEVEGNAKF
jgi:hypothetical protein